MNNKFSGKCGACGSDGETEVRERKPGTKGILAQSFAGRYWLCTRCFERAWNANAVENRAPNHGRRGIYYIVAAKTRLWLVGIHGRQLGNG